MTPYEQAEVRTRIIKALSHPVRLMVIDLLKGGEMTFTNIKGFFAADKSTISKHLTVLKDAGIVSSRKEGRDTVYRLEVPCIVEFLRCVNAVIENNVKKQQTCLCECE